MTQFALVLIGFSALTVQIICIREFIVLAIGNELIIGILFSNWLLFSALGSYLFTRKRPSLLTFPLLQLIFALTLPLLLLGIRLSPVLAGHLPGEGINLLFLTFTSWLFLGFLGFFAGAQFTAACHYVAVSNTGDGTTVYFFEALGSILSGFVSTFITLSLIDHFSSFWIISVLNILSASLLLFKKSSARFRIVVSGVLLVLLTTFLPAMSALDRFSISKQWPNYEIIVNRNSRYGNILLLKREDQSHLFCNGALIAVSPQPDANSVESFAHLPLLMHPNPQSVLFIGNGVSGIPAQVLKHPVQRVDYAELDPLVIRVAESYLQPIMIQKDFRLQIHHVDGTLFLKNSRKLYDIILINLPAPSSLELNRFYTREFFEKCRDRLNTEGIIMLTLPLEGSYMGEDVIELTNSIILAASLSFQHTVIVPNNEIFLIFSGSNQLHQQNSADLINRYERRHIDSKTITPASLEYLMNIQRRNQISAQIDLADYDIVNSIYHPRAVFYTIQHYNAQFAPMLRNFFRQIVDVPVWVIPSFLIVLFFSMVWLFRKNRIRTTVNLSVMGSGFCAMGISILCVFLFQSVFGYVYQWIGVLLTLFMIGTAAGCFIIVNHSTTLKSTRTYKYIELLWLVVLVCLLFLSYALRAAYIPEVYFKIGLMLSVSGGGFLIGAQYPTALNLLNRSPKFSGQVYASDLLGGWVGGFVISLILLPVTGIWVTGFLFIIIKLSTSILSFRFLNDPVVEKSL